MIVGNDEKEGEEIVYTGQGCCILTCIQTKGLHYFSTSV